MTCGSYCTRLPMMRSYTIAKKIEVVQWHRQAGRNVHETSRHFNIDRKRIREWDGKYESLLQQNFGKSKLRRKLSNGAPVFSEELDDALFEFFERERSAGRAEWLSRVWGPNTDDVRRLLVLDQAPIHKTQAARDALDERETDVAYVPACCTSILQPADVYWNRPFKANLRRSWEEFMRRAEKTPKGNLRKPSHQDVLDFVAAAWEAVSEETVAKSFKGCGISNALDGSEEGCLHGRLSDVGTVPPEHRDGLQAECCSLFFDTDSEDSFDGFHGLPSDEGFKVAANNFFSSLDLVKELNSRDIQYVGTLCQNRLTDCQIMEEKTLKKLGQGSHDYRVDNKNGLAVVRWFDRKAVTLVSNFASVEPMEMVKRYNRKAKKHDDVPCPFVRRCYSDGEGPRAMMKGPVYQLSDFSALDVGGFRQTPPADGSPNGCGA
ncbi:hypothetical protein HPB52_003124 [Rhipicephalus sanguineus]|uniref:Transposase n=1 Tax=Rhipicephalus sanguineus TaxID=34632 RepID=A0A9D4SVG5_RHISA|nr:hypothetical protein HPB52_003124 [Rhipicephalus sanguineus]